MLCVYLVSELPLQVFVLGVQLGQLVSGLFALRLQLHNLLLGAGQFRLGLQWTNIYDITEVSNETSILTDF